MTPASAGGSGAGRRVPAGVWAVTALHVFVLCLYGTLTATYQAPDEPHHVDLARVLASGEGWPVHGTRSLSGQVVASLAVVEFHEAFPDGLAAADAPPRPARPAFAELGGDGPTDEYNQITQHPPLYHAVAGGVLWLLRRVGAGAWSFDVVVGALRLVSIAFLAPVPLFAHAAARRLGAEPPVALAAAIFPLAVPQLSHIGASVNNDALLVLLFAALTPALAAVATGDVSLRTALVVGGITGAALVTKGNALVALPWIAAAYGLALARRAAPLAAVGARAAVAAAVATAAGGWWWLRNVVVGGHLFPDSGAPLSAIAPRSTAGVLQWGRMLADRLVLSFWGEFGWLDAALPGVVVAAASAVTASGVAAGLGLRRRGDRWGRADVVLLLLPMGCLTAGLAVQNWLDYTATGVLRGIQGRYLYPGLPALGVVVALGYASVVTGRRRWLPVAVLVAAIGMQAVGFATLLGGYWATAASGGVGAQTVAAVRGALAWSPWPVGVPLTLAVGAVGAGALTMVLLLRRAWSAPSAGAQI